MNLDVIKERAGELVALGRKLPGFKAKIAEQKRFKKFLFDVKHTGKVLPQTVIDYLSFRSIKKGEGWLKTESIVSIRSKIADYLDGKKYSKRNPARDRKVELFLDGYRQFPKIKTDFCFKISNFGPNCGSTTSR